MKLQTLGVIGCMAFAFSGCGSPSSGSSSNGSVSEIPPPPPPISTVLTDYELEQLEKNPGDKYEYVGTNPFVSVLHDPLSTFAVDVDTASYDIFRRDVSNANTLPQSDSVRVEEYINNFKYDYPAPTLDEAQPFSISLASAPNILDRNTQILRVGIQAAQPPKIKKKANLVFLIDVSGSMASSAKLPLVQLVLTETLGILDPDDTVSIVTYASGTGVLLEATPVSQYSIITSAINGLTAGGSTNGGAGIELAYEQAEGAFVKDGINHVILCTDGDFNVGLSNQNGLVKLIEEKRKTGVTFTSLGFGVGNLNDAMMEATSNAGNGIYGVISSEANARQYVENRMLSNLIYVAKDMKVQVEFNPSMVSSYRLIGYENRDIKDEDFRNDVVDAGEIGAGHRVTALYELVLKGNAVPDLKEAPKLNDGDNYAGPVEVDPADYVLVKVRYKKVDATEQDPALEVKSSLSKLSSSLESADASMRWAVAIAAFAEILKGSPFADITFLDQMDTIFKEQSTLDADREEFYKLFEKSVDLLKK